VTGPGERGSVSIVAAGLMAVALVLAMGAADLARVLTAAARAQTAADASALAAAQELALGSSGSAPADLAAEYADRNGATLTECSCEAGGTEATVTVGVEVGAFLLLSGSRVVTARARAVVDVPSGSPTPAVPVRSGTTARAFAPCGVRTARRSCG
jgi:secretion/DNA translocation related TadE-like protein